MGFMPGKAVGTQGCGIGAGIGKDQEVAWQDAGQEHVAQGNVLGCAQRAAEGHALYRSRGAQHRPLPWGACSPGLLT